jgi:uncharacterized membrane protein
MRYLRGKRLRREATMRLTILALVLGLALGGRAEATQEYILPTLFDVTGVEASDALNVRAGPGVQHPVIATLAPDAERIEVVAHDATGRWGQVNTGERAGWVSMRYLAYRTDVWEEGALPEGLRCAGTEPFWSLRPEGDALVYSTPEQIDGTAAPIAAVLGTGIFRDPRRAIVAEAQGLRLTASLTTQWCSDGMSDRAYGLTAMVVREDAEGATLLTGCCRLGE